MATGGGGDVESERRDKWDRGYEIPRHLQERIRAWHRTDTPVTLATCLADHGAILALGALGVWSVLSLPPWLALPLQPLLWLAIARFQRGLENLVHEGAHYNWLRKPQRVNDLLVTLLAALPTFTRVENYRRSHLDHHNNFGSDHDSDLLRYQRLDVEGLDRRRPLAFAAGLARRFGRYVAGWWRHSLEVDPGSLVYAVLWHAVVLVLPLSLLLGPLWGPLAWLAWWIVPFFLVLPWHRFVAEAAKHQYEGRDDVFTATVSNVGPIHRWWLHPHNDGYHLLHHVFPGVPHHRLRAAHAELLLADPAGYGRFRHRRRVLQEPDVGLGERGGGPDPDPGMIRTTN